MLWKITHWLRDWFVPPDEFGRNQGQYLCDRYRIRLETQLLRLKKQPDVELDQEIVEEIEKRFQDARRESTDVKRRRSPSEHNEGSPAWKHLQAADALIMTQLPEQELQREYEHRLLLGDMYLSEQAKLFFRKHKDEKDLHLLRQTLIHLVQDTHWRIEVRQVRRHYMYMIRRRTGIIFLASFALFFASPFLLEGLHAMADDTIFEPFINHIAPGKAFYYLFVALFSGMLGATFSILAGLRKQLDEASMDNLRSMYRYGHLISRACAGFGGAVIIFYLIRSGLITGHMFPNLVDLQIDTEKYHHELSKLVVISFLSGFSEKLVPGLLQHFESRVMSGKQKVEDDRP